MNPTKAILAFIFALALAIGCAAYEAYSEESDELVWSMHIQTKLGGIVVLEGTYMFNNKSHCEVYGEYLKQKHNLQALPKCQLLPKDMGLSKPA